MRARAGTSLFTLTLNKRRPASYQVVVKTRDASKRLAVSVNARR